MKMQPSLQLCEEVFLSATCCYSFWPYQTLENMLIKQGDLLEILGVQLCLVYLEALFHPGKPIKKE